MKIARQIDLGRSLRQVFGGSAGSEQQVEDDRKRQTQTAEAILDRFFGQAEAERRELVLLADEVGLGKTYVALTVAVSILAAIREGRNLPGLPANKPAILVLTPRSEALYNKWLREAEAFKRDCAHHDGDMDWLQVDRPLDSAKSGNLIHLTERIRQATRSKPLIIIARQGVFGAPLHDRDAWRRRALACVFEVHRIGTSDRPRWCRKVLGSGSQSNVPELLDLRKSNELWAETEVYSPDLYRAYQRALNDSELYGRIETAIKDNDGAWFTDLLDDLTRYTLAGDWPQLPLVIIDEIHGLKNRYTQARRHLERFLASRACRLLGLSATPFQLRHDELLSVLDLHSVIGLSKDRRDQVKNAVDCLADRMYEVREAGDVLRRRWQTLRPKDGPVVHAAWDAVRALPPAGCQQHLARVHPARVAYAVQAAVTLADKNEALQAELCPFVVRHRHSRSYREHFVGRAAPAGAGAGTAHFGWAPGVEVTGTGELTHYLMMRAVALAKDENGLPGLGTELTGSYRHLIETSAVWRRLAQAKNPLLPKYRGLLEKMIPLPEADREHCKIRTTVDRAMHFFKQGQKTLVFCVYTKTAEAVRDALIQAVEEHLAGIRDKVFEGVTAFENFRKRFFNRRELLYSIIQDQPLLGSMSERSVGVPRGIRLGVRELREVAALLAVTGESPEVEKVDRRLILAAVEHVAVLAWREKTEGQEWLGKVLGTSPDLADLMADVSWLDGRDPLSRSRQRRGTVDEGATTAGPTLDEEMEEDDTPQLTGTAGPAEITDRWLDRLRTEAVSETIAPYFRDGVIDRASYRLPFLAQHHCKLLAQLDLSTRVVAGQTIRRLLMADEFLLRYLADVPREETERWADYLLDRYTQSLGGHLESLRDRVSAYLETLVRAHQNASLLGGYADAAENRKVVQLVHGGTPNRDRYFLGFNTPYRPEILISTSVGQEGIDLHRECRHVVHHDLCWNPATVEQRTGRVDRIGSKVERERMGRENGGPTLEIAVPYLAATYDERMFEELYRRAQLFEVTMGGDMRVDGRLEADEADADKARRIKAGIGTEDEVLGDESQTVAVDLPTSMVERLRIDLSVWKPSAK